VDVVAEASRPTLERLLASLRRGPRLASVTDVEERWSGATREFGGFDVRD
jgi:acylphosphatase